MRSPFLAEFKRVMQNLKELYAQLEVQEMKQSFQEMI